MKNLNPPTGKSKRSSKEVRETITEAGESRQLVRAAFDLARSLGITRLLVQADEFKDVRLVENLRLTERIIWITRDSAVQLAPQSRLDVLVTLPDAPMHRMSQLNMALFLAVLNGQLELHETVLFLSGVAGSGRLDMLFVTNPKRDFPWFRKRHIQKIAFQHFARIIDIALRFATEGREGSAIGTTFVLGDLDQLSGFLRQLILNPCAGHPKKDRSIHNPQFLETLREYAAMDGAFVINNRGVVESAGTYLDAPLQKTILRAGLGARHAAALAITSVTDSVSVVLSSSSRTVTVFHEGETIFELQNPQSSATT